MTPIPTTPTQTPALGPEQVLELVEIASRSMTDQRHPDAAGFTVRPPEARALRLTLDSAAALIRAQAAQLAEANEALRLIGEMADADCEAENKRLCEEEAYIEGLRAENTNLKTQLAEARAGSWVSVQERLPEEAIDVQVYLKGLGERPQP